MWNPFARTAVEEPVEIKEAPAEPIEPDKLGHTVGKLTQFGTFWLNMNELNMIDFNPSDGCACEIRFKGSQDTVHLTNQEAAYVEEYIKASKV